ncbi:MAG: conjugal transfer protein TraF, partial [Thermoplasmata archaeon]
MDDVLFVRISLLLLMFFSISQRALADYYNNYNYTATQKGYWFYQTEPKPEKPKKIIPQPVQKTMQNHEIKKQPKFKKFYSEEEMMKMSVKQLHAVMKHLLDQAVSDPTVENVKDYLMAVDAARRKALAFTYMTMYVQQKYPQLSVLSGAPITQPGQNSEIRQTNDIINNTIKDGSNNYALLLFTTDNCQNCVVQKNILGFLTHNSNWIVRDIDITNAPEIKKVFHITEVPYLILIKRGDNRWFPIAAGVHSLDTIKHNMYYAIEYLNGNYSPKEWGLIPTEGSSMFNPEKLPKYLNQ